MYTVQLRFFLTKKSLFVEKKYLSNVLAEKRTIIVTAEILSFQKAKYITNTKLFFLFHLDVSGRVT